MSQDPSAGVEPDGDPVEGWPVRIGGVIETVIATEGPNSRWNQAALGVSPGDGRSTIEAGDTTAATGRTYGRTRTRRNLTAERPAYVQFTRDPVDFVAAALDVHETAAPVLESADAWARVQAEAGDRRTDAGTEVVEWRLEPVEAAVRQRSVPTTDRGYAAVVEATVAASRLDAPGYDEGTLLARLGRLSNVVASAGSERERAAFDWIDELVEWRGRRE